ncbi:STAS domain-containing protein [Streptomyces sp. NPDC054887]
MTLRAFESYAVSGPGDARVTLVGELDLDTAPYLHKAVAACLAERPKSLCLDLTGISFCDCAGANALLRARLSVLVAGVALAVEGVGAQPARLLAMIGAGEVLTGGTGGTGGTEGAGTVPACRE